MTRAKRRRSVSQVGTYAVVGQLAGILIGAVVIDQGQTVAGVILIVVSIVLGGAYWMLFRDRHGIKGVEETGFECVSCGSLQTDTITEFQPDGRERERRKCFACDHVWD